MNKIKSTVCVLMISLTLVSQFASPVTVYADEGTTPPPEDTPEVTSTPDPTDETAIPEVTSTPLPPEPTVDPESTSTASPPTDSSEPPTESGADPVETETPPPTDQVDPVEETVTTEEVTEEETVAEILAEIPDGTDLVVLDENGEPEPLATQEAAETIVTGDPVWCPDGVAPTPGANGCSSSYMTMMELISAIGATTNQNGTIWITSGNVGDTSPITIDGSTYAGWSNYSITLQGGWDGVSGNTAIGSNSVFSTSLAITNWQNNITGYNLTFENTTPTATPTANGLTIQTSKNTNLHNVVANGYGQDGINISSDGDTNLYNIVASGNGQDGINISSGGNTNLDNITADNNGQDGIDISSGGDTKLIIVGANGNGQDGINISSDRGTNLYYVYAYYNDQDGLNLLSGGDTFLYNVVAFDNDEDGINISSDGDVYLASIDAYGNGHDGIYISSNGDTDLFYIAASYNNNNGIHISTSWDSWITIGGCLYAIGNGNAGLVMEWVGGDGTAKLTNIGDINCSDFDLEFELILFTLNQGEFDLNCIGQAGFAVNLPNGDLVNIFCPVSGRASIHRLDKTGLPDILPTGYTYASAFTLDIIQNDEQIQVITESGYIQASFIAQPLQPGNTYSILYWDEDKNNWIELADFLSDESGAPKIFDLFPGNNDDTRKIISGVRINPDNGRVEVSTNFPGIFVLAQH